MWRQSRCFSLYRYATIRDTILPYPVLSCEIFFTGSRKNNGTGTLYWQLVASYPTVNFTDLFYSAGRSGGSVVDITLDRQSRDREIDPRFSGLSDETLNRGPVSV